MSSEFKTRIRGPFTDKPWIDGIFNAHNFYHAAELAAEDFFDQGDHFIEELSFEVQVQGHNTQGITTVIVDCEVKQVFTARSDDE